jgi:hypothetical protein
MNALSGNKINNIYYLPLIRGYDPRSLLWGAFFLFIVTFKDLKQKASMHHQYIQFYLDNKYNLSRYYNVKKRFWNQF